MRSKKMILKSISIILVQVFVFCNVAFAIVEEAPPAPEENKATPGILIEDISIPKDIGSVKTKYKGKAGKLIIHIQDAHCNYEAQTNISKMLKIFSKDHNVNLVSVEGADGVVDTAWFKAFPDAEIRREVADYFMKKGEITGAEFLSITEDYPIKLFGAENRKLYIRNLESFTSAYPMKGEIEKYLLGLKSILGKLKVYIYTSNLKVFDSKVEKYKDKKLTLSEYAKFLNTGLKNHNLALRKYPDFAKLVYTLIYEDKIDFDIVNQERTTVIDRLSKLLPKETLELLVAESVSFKTGKISAAGYYQHLKDMCGENGIGFSDEYPNLANYVIYTRLYEKINNEKLFEELDTIKGAIKNKLFQNEDQRKLSLAWDNAEILIGLINIKLANREFDYFKTHRDQFRLEFFTDFIRAKTGMYNLAYNIEPPPETIKDNLPKMESFYEIAVKRDNALVDNTIKAMKQDEANAAVLITGGFHTEGITRILEEKGISYVVVCPNITKDVESPYIKVLTNQRTPFEELLTESIVPAKEH